MSTFFNSYGLDTFSGDSFFTFESNQKVVIRNEIEGKSKDYILSVDEDEYLHFLYDKYFLELLSVHSEEIHEPQNIKVERLDQFRNQRYQVDAYRCTISYSFSGSPTLFSLAPTQRTWTSHAIQIDTTKRKVIFSFVIDRQDPDLFNNEKQSAYRAAFTNMPNINRDAERWNSQLKSIISGEFYRIKKKHIGENSFFEAIKAKVDPNTKTVFTPPTVKKKIIPQPEVSKKEFAAEPTWSNETYLDTLKVLFETGKAMEKKPSTYRDRDEEDLRDYFITLLETRYEATTVGGETFNKGGKTDILIKYQDGTNLFVGECKWWKGESEFNAAINQLFDNYLTWRDSKTALLFFVKNKEITTVCEKIKEAAQKHPYFKQYKGEKGEGRYSFVFHLPGDQNKDVYLEIMAFHFIAKT